jgi:hypothetical protein
MISVQVVGNYMYEGGHRGAISSLHGTSGAISHNRGNHRCSDESNLRGRHRHRPSRHSGLFLDAPFQWGGTRMIYWTVRNPQDVVITSLHGGAAEEPMRLCDDDDEGSSGTVGASGSSQQYICPAGLALFPAIVIVSTV